MLNNKDEPSERLNISIKCKGGGCDDCKLANHDQALPPIQRRVAWLFVFVSFEEESKMFHKLGLEGVRAVHQETMRHHNNCH